MPFTKEELKKFKHQLETIKEQLAKNVRNASEDVKALEEPKGYSQHQADEGTDDFDQRIAIELSTEGQGILREVDRALEKIEEGTYGICDISGEEIPKKRLEAIPYATMTVASQERYEKGLL
ncbi:MAG: TraR/DksA family transcriptional regulator [Chlamydiota bacterium]